MLWGLPYVIWIGLLAALLFASAIFIVSSGLVKGKMRLRVHRALATAGAVVALIHIYMALRPYFY